MMKEVVCLHSGASTSVPLLDRSLTQLEAGETASPMPLSASRSLRSRKLDKLARTAGHRLQTKLRG
jgi:hypothetical protein